MVISDPKSHMMKDQLVVDALKCTWIEAWDEAQQKISSSSDKACELPFLAAMFRNKGDEATAVSKALELTESCSIGHVRKWSSDVLLAVAKKKELSGDFTGALFILEKVVATCAEDNEVLLNQALYSYGINLFYQKRFSEAQDIFVRILRSTTDEEYERLANTMITTITNWPK